MQDHDDPGNVADIIVNTQLQFFSFQLNLQPEAVAVSKQFP
jgi:hypothetical protein